MEQHDIRNFGNTPGNSDLPALTHTKTIFLTHTLPEQTRLASLSFGCARWMCVLCIVFVALSTRAQLTGTKSVPGDYATLELAISALNSQGVGPGGVTLNLIGGNPQTAPLGGYIIGGAGSLVLTSTSMSNPVVIQGNNNTVTAPTPQTAGNLNDAIFKLIGADWITLTGFNMTENVANTTTTAASNNMTEWGVALLYVTATDGAQNNTIQGNSIDLDRTYQNTFGIYSNSTHTDAAVTTTASATGSLGGNHGLKILNNIITDVNNGIVVVGPTAAADHNDGLEIGTTALNGNMITNYGTTGTFSAYANIATLMVNGVLVRNTKGFTISFNTVTSSIGGTTSGTLNGIQIQAFSNTPVGTFVNTINNNTISLKSGLASGAMIGINSLGTSATATSTININNNNFLDWGHTVSGTGALTFLINRSAHQFQNIQNNTFTNMSVNTTGSVTFIDNDNSNTAVNGIKTVDNNAIVTAFTKTGSGGTVKFFTDGSSGTDVNGTKNILSNNTAANITLAGSATFTALELINGNGSGSSPNKSVLGNSVSNIVGGTGTFTGLILNWGAASDTIRNNTFNNITNGGTTIGISTLTSGSPIAANSWNIFDNTISGMTGSGTGAVTGLSIASATQRVINIYRNKIYDLTNTNASGSAIGITLSSGTTVSIYNNLIGNINATAASATNPVIGINITSSTTTSSVNVSYNTVYLNAMSSGTNFGSSALFQTTSATATTATLNLRNNILVNLSTANGTGVSSVYRRSSTTLTNYGSVSDRNLFYAGTPSSTKLVFFDGTNSDQNLSSYLTRVSPRDVGSLTENLTFLSTSGANANFLHLDTSVPTQVESAGINIAGITEDFDGIVRQGNGGYAGSGSAPDIGADEGEFIAIDLTAPGISYTPLLFTCSTADRGLNAVNITDGSGIPSTGPNQPRVYFKKGFSGSWASSQGTLATGTDFNGLWNFNIESATMGGLVAGDTIYYYVIAQDNAITPNVGSNPSTGLVATGVNSVSTPPSSPNFYTISNSLSGTYMVGAGQSAPNYPTLTSAIASYSTSCMTGPVVFVLLDADYSANETFPLTIGPNPDASATNTLSIRPANGTSVLLSGSNATALFDLNGGDYVTIDGSNNGSTSKDLTLRNTGTGPVIRLINEATNNIVKNTILESGNTSTTSGTVFFSTSATGTTGNSNNTINNCDLRDRTSPAAVPANAIYSSGTVAAPNAANTVSGCNVFNYTNAGVLVSATGAGNGWTVNPSHFYQTASRTAALTGIGILGGSGHNILNNFIGGSAPNASGSHLATSSTFRGIDLAVGTALVTNVQGNTIKNIRSTVTGFTASYGIYLQSGTANIGSTSGNTIGSSDPNERFEINGDSYAIRAVSTTTANVSNNVVNNFGTNGTPSTGEYYFGISIEGTGGSHMIINNTVMNLTNASAPDGSFDTRLFGLIVSATGIQTIRGNSIHDIGNTSVGAPATNDNDIWALLVSGTAAGTLVEKNTIYNIYGSSAGTGARADQVYGLWSEAVSNATYQNNFVSLSGGPSSDRFVVGIVNISASPSVNNYYFNTVHIYGAATATTPTYAFNKNSTGTVNIINNIFSNARTGGTGYHVALANTNTVATGWSSTASNYNVLYNVDGTHLTQWLGSAMGNNLTLAGWQAAQPAGSGGDLNSISVAPVFVSNTDLHLTQANVTIDRAGTLIDGITSDFDSNIRNFLTPDIGADEFIVGCSSMVLNNSNSGGGSLRDIIACLPAGETVLFDSGLTGQTITLTSGEIDINKSLAINGLGMLNLTLSGNNSSRLFHLQPGTLLRINDLALKNATALANGGAIFAEGNLTLRNVLLQGNMENGTPKSMTLVAPGALTVQADVDMKN